MFNAPSQNQLKRFQRLRREVIKTCEDYGLIEKELSIALVVGNSARDWFLVRVMQELQSTIWPDLRGELVVLPTVTDLAVREMNVNQWAVTMATENSDAFHQLEERPVIATSESKQQVVKAFMSGLLEEGKLSAIAPKMNDIVFDAIHIYPLFAVDENEINNLAEAMGVTHLFDTVSEEKTKLTAKLPVDTVFASLQNVVPEHLLDTTLYDFKALSN